MEAIASNQSSTGSVANSFTGRGALDRGLALGALHAHFSPSHRASAEHCAQRLHAILPDQHQLSNNTVMVAYGGGKDSSYMLAFVRMVQLLLYGRHQATFRMRVVTNRHAGMPRAVMENIDRCYRQLFLHHDPDCELLLIDGDEVHSFELDLPLPESLIRRNREDILVTGHRTQADARPTFCNACNLGMINAYGVASRHGSGVDIIITGDSRREQRAYSIWINRLAQQFDLRPEGSGFGAFLSTANRIATRYFRDIHVVPARVRARRINPELNKPLQIFSIYEDTGYAAGDHWSLLVDYLGFQFDDLAFSFTESDCANPALMAHLRGIKCERVYGRSYREGIDEYVRFATGLMEQKEYPAHLIETMRQRYADELGVHERRIAINNFALQAYGLSKVQLVCMVVAPFTERGRNLEVFLKREHPVLAHYGKAIHSLLQQEGPPADAMDIKLARCLQGISGLELSQMRMLYASEFSIGTHEAPRTILAAVLQRDPHKAVIETRHAPNGPVVHEILSGR
jgi:hypothetical protein